MDLLSLLPLLGVPAEHAATIAVCVVGVSSILAAILPNPEPGSPWAKARGLLDMLAMNVGRARNRTLADELAVRLIAAGAALPETTRSEPAAAPWADLPSVLQGLKR